MNRISPSAWPCSQNDCAIRNTIPAIRRKEASCITLEMITVAVTMLFTTTSPKLTPSLSVFSIIRVSESGMSKSRLTLESVLPRIDRLLWFFPRGSPLYAVPLRSPPSQSQLSSLCAFRPAIPRETGRTFSRLSFS